MLHHGERDHQGRVERRLNEAEVVGLRLAPSSAWCDLLLHVVALPRTGPLDPGPRRVLRLGAPGRVVVLLRADQTATTGYGDAVPLTDLDAVEEFFAALTWSGAMYGWSFLDDPALMYGWPVEPSLALDLRTEDAAHSLFWFNECGLDDEEDRIEGTVTFDDLKVLRADQTPEPLEEFVGDGARYWRALHARDERLGVDAQMVAQSTRRTWRSYSGVSVMVSGADPEPGGQP